MTTNPSRAGELIECCVAGETYHSYLPKPLPPLTALKVDTLCALLDKAYVTLGRLDGLSILLPDPSLFPSLYIRKEAVLSSQIAGMQASLFDLLLYEDQAETGARNLDVVETLNYIAAMEHGLKCIQKGSVLSLQLMREMHAILLSKGHSNSKQLAKFRESQNWIGGTGPGNAQFVPPPPEKILGLLSGLENFLQNKKFPTLAKVALAHYQFETIHPFLDGNGRLGRLLIMLVLYAEGIMRQPMLYLSLYFKMHKQSYYDHLQRVRETGDWEEWIQFFLKGVITTAEQAITTAQMILKIFTQDREKIESIGKASTSLLIVHHYLQQHPIAEAKKIVAHCKISLPAANKSLQRLSELDIVKALPGKSRNKIYVYQRYLNRLNENAERRAGSAN